MIYKQLPQPKTHVHDAFFFPPGTTSEDLTSFEFLREATFAADSFWKLETAFGRVDGVLRTAAGYYGGILVKPSYREVSEGTTGHTEENIIQSPPQGLLGKPCSNQQNISGVNTHHRSAIFCGSEEEKRYARESKIHQQMKLNKRIVTKILPCGNITGFYLAESHLQRYYLQRHQIRLCERLSWRSSEHFANSHIACKLNGIFGGDERNVAEDLMMFIGRYELPDQTKLVLEGIIQELRGRLASQA